MSSPAIAVVTPYYKEPTEFLQKCHESVMNQTVPVRHYMVSDGHPLDQIDSWDVAHVKLPGSHNDNGNTPRGIGALLAEAAGFDFIAFLDADNWFYSTHIESLLTLHQTTNANVCSSFRTYHAWSGEDLSTYEIFENNLQHVDTSCYFIARKAFSLNQVWIKMPKVLSPICDRIFLQAVLHARHPIASSRQRTVAFRSQYKTHYERAAFPYPDEIRLKTSEDNIPCARFLASEAGIRDCIDSLGFWPVFRR
jgi:glycosyltransferase involved in cell wall biosynthesis